MGLAKELVYKSHQNLTIESTFNSERIMITSNGINHWKTLLRPQFYEELKMAIYDFSTGDIISFINK